MPRALRPVIPDLPHHVVQRGNHGARVFFCDSDRTTYLDWLCEYSSKYGLDVIAYCLMDNHVHLVAVPAAKESLGRALQTLQMRYAQRINRAQQLVGHLWQGRYFSAPLDESYFWTALRYVERNPVRAGMVPRAEAYRWSSAAPHCGLRDDRVLTRAAHWLESLKEVRDWPAWLADTDTPARLAILRRNTGRGLPCGSEAFVRTLGERLGRPLEWRPRGGQTKVGAQRGQNKGVRPLQSKGSDPFVSGNE